MEIEHTDDLEGKVAELEAAFQAALLDEQSIDSFLDLLEEDMETLYEEKRRKVWISLEWMHRSLSENAADFVEKFQQLTTDPLEFFLDFRDHPAIVSVTCSGLLQLIPQKERLGFVRMVVLREGPHCKIWVRVLQQHAVPDDDIAELIFDLLEDEESTPAARDKLVKQLLSRRQPSLTEQQPEFLVLGAEEYQIAMELCAEHDPQTVLKSLDKSGWTGTDRAVTWQVHRLAGSNALAAVIEVAMEFIGDSAEFNPRIMEVLRSFNLETLIEVALREDDSDLFHGYKRACYQISESNLVWIYQTRVHDLIKRYPGELADKIDKFMRRALQSRGWHFGIVFIRMSNLKPLRYIERERGGTTIRYIQPHTARFFPAQGEEVMYNARNARRGGERTYTINFLKLG